MFACVRACVLLSFCPPSPSGSFLNANDRFASEASSSFSIEDPSQTTFFTSDGLGAHFQPATLEPTIFFSFFNILSPRPSQERTQAPLPPFFFNRCLFIWITVLFFSSPPDPPPLEKASKCVTLLLGAVVTLEGFQQRVQKETSFLWCSPYVARHC